jgi:hypothetical protein
MQAPRPARRRPSISDRGVARMPPGAIRRHRGVCALIRGCPIGPVHGSSRRAAARRWSALDLAPCTELSHCERGRKGCDRSGAAGSTIFGLGRARLVSVARQCQGAGNSTGGGCVPAALLRRAGFIYIGISARLSSRLGGLRRARRRQDKRGHYAAACVAAHEKNGKTVEVSWATVGDMDRRELIGHEVDLIAAHRESLSAAQHAISMAS